MVQIWHSRTSDDSRDSRERRVPRLDAFTDRLLDMVVQEYGHRRSTELSTMTHAEAPWLAARGDLGADCPSNAAIDSAVIAAHYRSEHELCGFRASELAVLGLPEVDGGLGKEFAVQEPTAIDDLPDDEWGGANLFVVPGSAAR